MSEEAFKRLPPKEQAVRRKLGEAMVEFVLKIVALKVPGEDMDDAMRQHLTENYRLAVEEAAAQGVEGELSWHTLAVWTEDGRERIGYFSRVLEYMDSGRDADFKTPGPGNDWTEVHMRADCLFEIGRVHAHEGAPEVARDFLLRALPLAQEAERLRGAAGIMLDDRLEGRIAELLVQLPDEVA
jgi:hypothetical protein